MRGGRGRRAYLVIVFAAVVASGGCWVAYRPATPHEARVDGVTAHVIGLTEGLGELAVDAKIAAPAGGRAANAWLTTPGAAACASGLPIQAQHPGAVLANQRVFGFDAETADGLGLLDKPSVIDLDLVPADPTSLRRCLRVPVTQATEVVEWRAYQRWFVSTGVRFLHGPASPNVIGSGVLVSFGGGVWVGPLRLRLDWLFGQADTNRLPPTGFSNASAEPLGGDAAVEMFPLHVGAWGMGVQLGYEYLATDFDSQSGTTENDVYKYGGPRGPRVALRLARLPSPQPWRSFAARPDSLVDGCRSFRGAVVRDRWDRADALRDRARRRMGTLVVTDVRGAVARVALVGSLAVTSCMIGFHPLKPRSGANADVSVSVEQIVWTRFSEPDLDEALGVRVTAEMAARPGAAWGTPSLNAISQQPCAHGIRAQHDASFVRSPGQSAAVTLSFSGPAVERSGIFAGDAAALDLPVFPADRGAAPRCLRIQLQTPSGEPEWRATPWMIGIEMRAFFLTTPLPNYEGTGLLLALPQGLWIGPWRLAAAFEAGLVDERGVAPPATPSNIRPTVAVVGGALELDRVLVTKGHLGLEAQLAYDLLATVQPNAQSDPAQFAAYRGALLHGPRVSLRALVLLARPDWRGFEAPPDVFSFGLSVFAGTLWQAPASSAPSPLFGFSLDGNIGL